LLRDAECFLDRNWTTLNTFVERLAFHEFQHKKPGIAGFLQIVDAADIRVI
jgi:hypothetical protein